MLNDLLRLGESETATYCWEARDEVEEEEEEKKRTRWLPSDQRFPR